MKTAIKWVAILCVLAWAAKNPAVVGADVHSLFNAGQSLVNSVANAVGGAVSGAAGGAH
jgi:hypothetical protein